MAKKAGKTRSLGEFALIEKLFAPLAEDYPLAFGLKDDAAIISPRAGCELVVTKDVLVAGVHFLADDPADLVARKALRVNLSDLAAKGARPIGYLLGAVLPKGLDTRWIKRFVKGLAEDQAEFGVSLIGGDTVSTPGPLTLSITAFGEVPKGSRMLRSGAHEDDGVYVTGTIGDAALGLAILKDDVLCPKKATRNALIDRYRLPRPRLGVGPALSKLATAGLDVSDGLIADLGHICEASGLGAEIVADDVPLSGEARVVLERDPALLNRLLTGGDDYELVFTAPPGRARAIAGLGRRAGVAITRIGRMTRGSQVRVVTPDGRTISIKRAGYTHF
jgi:thiamine-monophosphate kinase